jgi:hypothetical protein
MDINEKEGVHGLKGFLKTWSKNTRRLKHLLIANHLSLLFIISVWYINEINTEFRVMLKDPKVIK